MNERVKILRLSLKLTQKEFANKIGLQTTTVCDIERGRCPVVERTIIAICSIFNVNEQWLRYGQGEMILQNDKMFNDFYEIYKTLNEPLQDYLVKTANNLIELQKDIEES